jgi:hypothetical protein
MGRHKGRWKDDVGNIIRNMEELIIGEKQRRIRMAGGEQLRRRLLFMDSGAIEEEEELCPLDYICAVNMEYKRHHGSPRGAEVDVVVFFSGI